MKQFFTLCEIVFWNIIRSFMISIATAFPPNVGMLAAKICNQIPSYPDESGCFRTDVAICAIGILRQGGIKEFEHWVARYPFCERWQGMFHPNLFKIHFNQERGWHILNITHCDRQYGRAVIRASI